MKLNKKQIGYRIRLIRQEQGLTIEEFGNLFDASKGVISNWENGRNIPNNKRLKQIAELGNTTVEYLLKGSPTLENNIISLENDIKHCDKEIKEIQDKIDSIHKNFKSLNEDSPEMEIYENELISLNQLKLFALNDKDLLTNELIKTKELIEKHKRGEIFNLSERENQEFVKNGISQFRLSEELKGLPYLLNYESTMKVVEYARMLMEKEENRFNP